MPHFMSYIGAVVCSREHAGLPVQGSQGQSSASLVFRFRLISVWASCWWNVKPAFTHSVLSHMCLMVSISTCKLIISRIIADLLVITRNLNETI